MTYKVIFNTKERTDEFGHFPAKHEEFNIPYEFREKVWYCKKKGKKYAVYETYITGIWATNTVGVTLNGDLHVNEDWFDRIFKDKSEAIDWCLKQNQRCMVKVCKMGY